MEDCEGEETWTAQASLPQHPAVGTSLQRGVLGAISRAEAGVAQLGSMLPSLSASRPRLASVCHNQGGRFWGGGLDLSHHSVFAEPLHEQPLIVVWILKLCCKTSDARKHHVACGGGRRTARGDGWLSCAAVHKQNRETHPRSQQSTLQLYLHAFSHDSIFKDEVLHGKSGWTQDQL